VNLGAVYQAVMNVHQDWLRDNRVEYPNKDSGATLKVNKKDDIGTAVSVSIPTNEWNIGIYCQDA
jgi:hypothetical protein